MDISKVINAVKAGGFKNPISNGVNAALSSITIPSLPTLTSMAAAQGMNTADPVVLGKLEAAQTSMTDAYNGVQALLGHSDRISGVNLDGNGTIASIAKTMASAKKISGESSCSTVLSAFGAIQNASTLINKTLDMVSDITKMLENLPAEIDVIPTKLAYYAESVLAQIESDVQALVSAQIEVAKSAVAQNIISLFQDECISQVLAGVMGDALKNEVSKVVEDTKAKTTQAVFGVLSVPK